MSLAPSLDGTQDEAHEGDVVRAQGHDGGCAQQAGSGTGIGLGFLIILLSFCGRLRSNGREVH